MCKVALSVNQKSANVINNQGCATVIQCLAFRNKDNLFNDQILSFCRDQSYLEET